MHASSCRLAGILGAFTLTLAGPVWAAPASSAAATDASEPGDDAVPDPAMEAARRLHNQGSAAYELADYPAALEKFSAAYVALPPGPQTAAIRSAIVYNVGITQKRMYELDGDLVHLKTAKVLLTRYFDDFAKDGAQEDSKGRALLAEIEAELEAELAAQDAQLATPPPTIRPASPGSTATPPAQANPDAQRRARMLIGVGAGALGLGAVGAGLGMGGALWGRSLQAGIEDGTSTGARRITDLQDGRSANTLAIAGALCGGVLLTAGAVLVAVGLKRRKAASEGLTLGPTASGFVVGGRF